MSKDCEIWKDIPGFEGRYQAGSFGNIKSLSRIVNTGTGKRNVLEIIRKVFVNKKTGYAMVAIRVNKKFKQFSVHRLIGIAYLQNKEKKKEINHKNGIKTDNRVENLEWVTSSENSKHKYDILKFNTLNNKGSKKIAQYKEGDLIRIWPSGAEVERGGFNVRNVYTAMKLKRKCAGFNWQRV